MKNHFFLLAVLIVAFSVSCASVNKGHRYYGRRDLAEQWYTPARFGMFYHWGLYTGGGSSSSSKPSPFHYKSIKEFEKAVGSAEKFAENLVAMTKYVGARYLIITLFHSCDKYMVIYPTKVPNFPMKTEKDYLGAVLRKAHAEGLKVICYYPSGGAGLFPKGISKENREGIWENILTKLFTEMRERYGKDSIDGFWMDGFHSTWKPVAKVFPNALRIQNNAVCFYGNPPPDISTTEFLSGPCSPAYNRPSGRIRPFMRWGDDALVARKDYNEDIPTCNGWWYQGGKCLNNYVKNPIFWIKQMICSLGQRGKWNYAMGLGPLVDGSCPPEFKPMFDKMHEFMRWAAPAIYNSAGGEGAPIQQGWLNSGAFATVLVDRKSPGTYYLCVTEPPSARTKSELKIQHDWVKVKSITDLRTGTPAKYKTEGPIIIYNSDWSDIKNYGAKIYKIVIEPY